MITRLEDRPKSPRRKYYPHRCDQRSCSSKSVRPTSGPDKHHRTDRDAGKSNLHTKCQKESQRRMGVAVLTGSLRRVELFKMTNAHRKPPKSPRPCCSSISDAHRHLSGKWCADNAGCSSHQQIQVSLRLVSNQSRSHHAAVTALSYQAGSSRRFSVSESAFTAAKKHRARCTWRIWYSRGTPQFSCDAVSTVRSAWSALEFPSLL